jgi:hypothetical protein
MEKQNALLFKNDEYCCLNKTNNPNQTNILKLSNNTNALDSTSYTDMLNEIFNLNSRNTLHNMNSSSFIKLTDNQSATCESCSTNKSCDIHFSQSNKKNNQNNINQNNRDDDNDDDDVTCLLKKVSKKLIGLSREFESNENYDYCDLNL